MSVEVKGLAEIVRQAKDAIRTASDAAASMRSSATDLAATVGQVLDMQKQLDAANADLKAAVGAMSNGGPPLASTTTSVAPPPISSTDLNEAGVVPEAK